MHAIDVINARKDLYNVHNRMFEAYNNPAQQRATHRQPRWHLLWHRARSWAWQRTTGRPTGP